MLDIEKVKPEIIKQQEFIFDDIVAKSKKKVINFSSEAKRQFAKTEVFNGKNKSSIDKNVDISIKKCSPKFNTLYMVWKNLSLIRQ